MAGFSDETLKEITSYIEEQGLAWARDFIATRKGWLTRQKITASRELIDSLRSEVSSRLGEALQTRIEVEFAAYGRMVEMRRMQPAAGGTPYLEGLEEWIEEKKLDTKFIRRYVAGRKLRKVPANVLNQIAWGIVVNRRKRYRRRQWWNRPKAAAITDLYNRIAANLPDLVAEEIKAAFGKKANS